MEENKRIFKLWYLLPEAGAILLALAGVWGIGYFKQLAQEEQLRNLVMTALGVGVTGLLIRLGYQDDSLDYDNGKHLIRFWVSFYLCMAVAFCCVLLPVSGWPYTVIFVALSLFGNSVTGIVSASVLLMVTVLLSGASTGSFLLYFLSGILAVVCFRRLDSRFKIGVPLLLSMMVLFVCETANQVLFANEHLNGEMFVIPIANVIVSCILLVGLLKLFSSMVIYKYRVRYMELTDSECTLLSQFKEQARQEYYQCMHTAYFCDRIARKLGLDSDAVKAAGFYHKIGCILEEKGEFEQIEKLLLEYRFPPMVHTILEEYLSKKVPILHKETAVLLFADAVTASVMYMLSRDKSAVPDYDKIIDMVFKKRMESGILKKCTITMQEITAMQKIFKEEKLYYDFLR